jgi:hypothetical protein
MENITNTVQLPQDVILESGYKHYVHKSTSKTGTREKEKMDIMDLESQVKDLKRKLQEKCSSAIYATPHYDCYME